MDEYLPLLHTYVYLYMCMYTLAVKSVPTECSVMHFSDDRVDPAFYSGKYLLILSVRPKSKMN